MAAYPHVDPVTGKPGAKTNLYGLSFQCQLYYTLSLKQIIYSIALRETRERTYKVSTVVSTLLERKKRNKETL